MASFEIDVLVSVRTKVEHPGLTDHEAAQHIAKGRVRMGMRTLNDAEVIGGFTILNTLVEELETS